MNHRAQCTILLPALLIGLLAVLVPAGRAAAASGLGPRLGLSESDDLFVGVQGEFGRIAGEAVLAPSLDLKLGDSGATTANCDLRWYLLHLPETGLRFYGAAGPTLQLSPGSELGLSLTLGLNIPMQKSRRYNLEYRFGLGDIPEHKLAMAVLFGL